MHQIALKRLTLIIALFSLTFLVGCAGMEFAPKHVKNACCWYFPSELVEADRAVSDAQKAGKDKVCPAEFGEAAAMKNKAYDTYVGCTTEEAKKTAKEATKMAKALCPAKAKSAEKILAKFTLTINFDFDKAKIRKSDMAQLKKAIDFIKKYPGSKIRLEGHTDSIGTEKYNQKLSEKRAEATNKYLIDKGAVAASRMTTIGYGESKPVASNKTRKGRSENRRVEILILGD